MFRSNASLLWETQKQSSIIYDYNLFWDILCISEVLISKHWPISLCSQCPFISEFTVVAV